jgi:hypothetical protein
MLPNEITSALIQFGGAVLAALIGAYVTFKAAGQRLPRLIIIGAASFAIISVVFVGVSATVLLQRVNSTPTVTPVTGISRPQPTATQLLSTPTAQPTDTQPPPTPLQSTPIPPPTPAPQPPDTQPTIAILTAQQVLDLLVPDSAERALATAHSENNGIINWVVDTKNGGLHGREITFSHPGYGGFDYWGGYKPTNDQSCAPRLDTDPISKMPEWYVVCTQPVTMPSKMDGVTWWPHGK